MSEEKKVDKTMSNVKNDTTDTVVETLPITVTRDANAVPERDKFLKAAADYFDKWVAEDKEFTTKVVDLARKLTTSDEYKENKKLTAEGVASMALSLMGKIPQGQILERAAVRVDAFFSGSKDKFLRIAKGRNAGTHVISRYNADELKKLRGEK